MNALLEPEWGETGVSNDWRVIRELYAELIIVTIRGAFREHFRE